MLALDMYSELIHGPFDRETAAIARFATDEKMKKVWDELLRRQRPAGRFRDLHPRHRLRLVATLEQPSICTRPMKLDTATST